MASGQTTNYGLHKWTAEDRVLMDEFNQNSDKIDAAVAAVEEKADQAPKIVFGAYTGDGTTERTIPLEATPRAVIVWRVGAQQFYDGTYAGGMAFAGHPVSSAIEVKEGGFLVRYTGKMLANVENFEYYYMAIL